MIAVPSASRFSGNWASSLPSVRDTMVHRQETTMTMTKIFTLEMWANRGDAAEIRIGRLGIAVDDLNEPGDVMVTFYGATDPSDTGITDSSNGMKIEEAVAHANHFLNEPFWAGHQ